MRSYISLLTVLMLSSTACLAGESLVNGSFEDGTNSGWSIIAWRPANYHNPPIRQCVCGHNLTAPHGDYFAGITYASPLPDPPASPGHVYYLQGVDVKNYNPDADRTRYEFEIWVQIGREGKFKEFYQNNQRYVIWWTDDGLMPNDGAHVRIQGTINEGDTIEIDAAGPNRRVYEFDTNGSILPTSDIAVPAGDRKWSTVVPAFIAAVNNDSLAPCTAVLASASSAPTSWESEAAVRQREIVLTWKQPDANGALVTSEHNTAGQVFTTNFLRAAGAVQHAFPIQFMIPAVWIMDADNENANNLTDWRRLKVSGSIPATPRSVVLEIDLFTQSGTTTRHNCFDDVVFSAESATGSAVGPFDGDVAPVYDPPGDPNGQLIGYNSGFEIAPYDQNHSGGYVPDPPPGWGLWAKFTYDPSTCTKTGGPIKGYTNGQTTPNDPLGIVTPSGDHFFGRSKINTGTDPCILEGKNLEGWWGHVLPVRNWSPCATGMRWRAHYLTKMWDENNSGFQWLQVCWDAQPAWNSILNPPANPNDAQPYLTSDDLFARIELFAANDRSITKPVPTEFSGFSEFEQVGELTMTDLDGLGHVPQHVLLKQKIYVSSSGSQGDHTRAFKFLFDKVDFYAEAIIPPDLRLIGTLPDANCDQLYRQEVPVCGGQAPLTFSLVSGTLPSGLTLSSDGVISGQPHSTGTWSFTVRAEDATLAEAVKEFQMIISGTQCCGAIAADFDADGDVDQEDFGRFQECVTGMDGGIRLPPGAPDCTCADLDRDGLDVDQADIEKFEWCASGPGIAADTTCDEEACCLADGGCVDSHPGTCATHGGTAQGPGTRCATTQCPSP